MITDKFRSRIRIRSSEADWADSDREIRLADIELDYVPINALRFRYRAKACSAENAGMPKSKPKRNPKTVLRLPDLEQSRSAVLNSLTSPSSQRAYDHAIRDFIDWYCSEPRLAFNRTVVTRYRINLEQESATLHRPSTYG